MSSRPIAKKLVIDDGAMSSDITSQVSIIQQISLISYAYSWTGTSPVGTVEVQVSNDYSEYPNGAVQNAGTWNTLPLAVNGSLLSQIAITGNSGNGQVDIQLNGGYAIRTVYRAASGSGTLDCTVNGKVA